DHRNTEPIRHLHHPDRLAVTLRARTTELVLETRLGVVTSLQTKYRDRLTVEPRQAGNHGIILAKCTVTCQRCKVGEQLADIVEAVRSVRMTRDLDLLPWRQLFVDISQRIARTLFKPRDFVSHIDSFPVLGKRLQ